MKDFHDSHVQKRSHRLTLGIYAATLNFPREEPYGLTSRLPRVVEKMGNNEFQSFLQIASGSASELDCELLLAKDLGYLAKPDYAKIADELSQIRKMLSALLRKVNVDRKG